MKLTKELVIQILKLIDLIFVYVKWKIIDVNVKDYYLILKFMIIKIRNEIEKIINHSKSCEHSIFVHFVHS